MLMFPNGKSKGNHPNKHQNPDHEHPKQAQLPLSLSPKRSLPNTCQRTLQFSKAFKGFVNNLKSFLKGHLKAVQRPLKVFSLLTPCKCFLEGILKDLTLFLKFFRRLLKVL
jgi:hypothetical protein